MSDAAMPSAFGSRVRKVRARAGEIAGLRRRVKELSNDVTALQTRVQDLEEELLDARSQGRRVAEISDMVTELLANEASRRDPEFQKIVARYMDE
jgi:hypothetical protein